MRLRKLANRASSIFMMALLAIVCCLGGRASAGPPFLTDDPEPVEYEHWELYAFTGIDAAKADKQISAPAFEMNYGFAPNFQFHAAVPFLATIPKAGQSHYGAGDTELGIKYRFLQETNDSPMAGVFPMLEVPTGQADQGLGNGRAWAKFPLWLQKSWGTDGRQWTTYGGGGYAVNTAPGQQNFPFAGWLLQKDINDNLMLGGEVFAQGKADTGGQYTVIGNFGGSYKFTENCSLLFSLGHSIAGQRHLVGYVGLYWTW
jgi:hypothetical protein